MNNVNRRKYKEPDYKFTYDTFKACHSFDLVCSNKEKIDILKTFLPLSLFSYLLTKDLDHIAFIYTSTTIYVKLSSFLGKNSF